MIENIDKLKVVIVGCTPLAQSAYDCLKAMKYIEVTGVVNLHYELSKGKSNYTIVLDKNIHFARDINSEETCHWVEEKKPDIILQLGWSQIFKKRILNIPKIFCVGIHPSPLPMGRGAAVLNWKLIEGKRCLWGNSLFLMKRKIDNGKIFDSESFMIVERDNIKTLYDKVIWTSNKMLKRTFQRFYRGDFAGVEQDKKRVTKYMSREPADGEMDVAWNGEDILNYVRALTHPFPGAYFNTKYGKLIIRGAQRHPYHYDAGTEGDGKIYVSPGKGVVLFCGDRENILLTEVTYNGMDMWADEWATERQIEGWDNLKR